MTSAAAGVLADVPQEIETERLVLRSYRREQAKAAFEAVEESREHLRAHMAGFSARVATLDDAVAWIADLASQFELRTTLGYAVVRRDDGAMLGGAGLHRPDWGARRFEVGYWLRASAVGCGFASEASRALTRMAFEKLAARRVCLHCDATNDASRKVAERLGFVREARLRNDRWDAVTGKLHDTLIFALTPEDWATSAWR